MTRTKIAVHLITDDNAYQIQSKEEALAAGRRLDVELELQFAGGDAGRQIHQIYEHIHGAPEKRPDALIIEAVRDGGMERVVRNAVQAGIGVILVHGDGRCIEAVRRESPDALLCWVTADNREIGRIQGQQFRALRPLGGLVLYATGPTASATAQQRLEGAQEALKGSTIELSIVAGDWTGASGEKSVSDWLRLVVPGGIVPVLVGCQCDDIGAAAKRALAAVAQELRKPEIAQLPVTGVDGVKSFGQRLVAQGDLVATVMMPVATGPALELAVQALREHRPAPARLVLAPSSHPALSSLRPL